FIERYFSEMKQILESISHEQIDRVVEALYSAWVDGRTIFLMGNGGSASTATHFACDLSKVTLCAGKARMRAISLCDNPALLSALTNDEGFEHIFSEQLRSLMRPGDVLIGISVHGGSGADKAGLWSQNLLRAMRVAKEEFQAVLIGFSGFDGGAFREMADVCLTVPFPSTPQVESFHLVLEHLITFCLREKIAACEH
ncbi:MAG: SIS domain-containing protein, partial [Bryobacteraceae bacterium]